MTAAARGGDAGHERTLLAWHREWKRAVKERDEAQRRLGQVHALWERFAADVADIPADKFPGIREELLNYVDGFRYAIGRCCSDVPCQGHTEQQP